MKSRPEPDTIPHTVLAIQQKYHLTDTQVAAALNYYQQEGFIGFLRYYAHLEHIRRRIQSTAAAAAEIVQGEECDDYDGFSKDNCEHQPFYHTFPWKGGV